MFQTDGLLLTMSGFNHKLPVLLQHILDMLYHLEFTDEMFEMYRENLKREYDNFAKSQPYQQCLTNTMCLLQSVRELDCVVLFFALGCLPSSRVHGDSQSSTMTPRKHLLPP
jgi:hypothetical protein